MTAPLGYGKITTACSVEIQRYSLPGKPWPTCLPSQKVQWVSNNLNNAVLFINIIGKKKVKNNDSFTRLGTAGLVTSWDQRSLTLAVTGEVRVIRLWDAETELKKQDIPTGADCCATHLNMDRTGNLMALSCGDGSVRLFDRRLSPMESRVMTWREHNSWVLAARLKEFSGRTHLVSGSSSGDIRIFDLRKNSSINVFQTMQSITTAAIHETADIFAW